MQPVFTYMLREPGSGAPIYVGKGVWDRAYKHRFQKSPIGEHVRSLVSQGLTPTYERIPAKTVDEAFEMEELLVAMIGRKVNGSGSLFNVRPGGKCFSQPESTRRKLAEAHAGKALSEAHRAAISAALSGAVQSEERKNRQSARMKAWWEAKKSSTTSRRN